MTLKKQIDDRLKGAGYAYGEVKGHADVDRTKHEATISIEVTPGPLVHMGKSRVEGNGVLSADKLLHTITWREGDRFDPLDLATTRGRLYGLGVFSSVQVELPEEPTDVADVAVRVKPGTLRELRIGGGVAAESLRDEVRARFEWSWSNFLGGLRRLRLRFEPAYVVLPSVTNTQRGGVAADNDLQLTQPDLFGTRATGRAVVGYDVGIDVGYQFHGPRAGLGVQRSFVHDRLLVGLAWDFQYLRFFNVQEDVFNGASGKFYGYENPYLLGYLDGFVQLDLRDRPLNPTYGAYIAVYVEQGDPAFGGAFRYTKLSPELRLYAPLGSRIVLAARGLVGWMSPYGGSTSPITRRFRLGGPSSHRGFSIDRLSPQVRADDGTIIPYGGDGEVLFSVDVRLQVTTISGNWLDVVPFFDAGDVTQTFSELDLGNSQPRDRDVARVRDAHRRRARGRGRAPQPAGRHQPRPERPVCVPPHAGRGVLRCGGARGGRCCAWCSGSPSGSRSRRSCSRASPSPTRAPTPVGRACGASRSRCRAATCPG